MKNIPYVSLIVPVWFKDDKGKQMTFDAIDSMEKTNYPNYDIIIVDDCSPYEDSFHLLNERYGSRHVVIEMAENGGSTVAVNEGIKYTKAPFIQYQNNDVLFPDPNWLTKQMELFEDEKVGVVGCKLRYEVGKIQHCGACWRDTEQHVIDHIGQNQDDIKPIKDVPFVTGCGMTVRREILEENGGGFTVFKGYGWDDIDIQVKAKEWGYKVQVAFEAEFTHFGSISYRQRPELASQENYAANKARFESIEIKEEETIEHFINHYYLV